MTHRLGLLATSLFVCGCVSGAPPPPPPPTLDGVEITFGHRGSLLDASELRFFETGEPDGTLPGGDDFWLRLSNRSPFTISFPTQSMYFSQPPELVRISPTDSVFAIEDGAVLVVLFDGYDGRYGFGDQSFVSHLPSGRSVLFQVPKRYLRENREIYLEFIAYTEAVVNGAARPRGHRVSFRCGPAGC